MVTLDAGRELQRIKKDKDTAKTARELDPNNRNLRRGKSIVEHQNYMTNNKCFQCSHEGWADSDHPWKKKSKRSSTQKTGQVTHFGDHGGGA